MMIRLTLICYRTLIMLKNPFYFIQPINKLFCQQSSCKVKELYQTWYLHNTFPDQEVVSPFLISRKGSQCWPWIHGHPPHIPLGFLPLPIVVICFCMFSITNTWTSLSQEETSLSNHAYARSILRSLSTMIVTIFW